MADPLREGKKRFPAKNYEADKPVPALGDNKGRKRASVRPDGIATQSRHSKRKRTGQAHPTLASGGFPEQNPQDPFQRLSSVEVGLVIDSLPVESTHTLRLVSKLWKACSEYHNGVLAIRRHFPHSALAKRTYDTREEANLQFRRLLYHQESLKKGLATRATRYTSTRFWHLMDNMLLCASEDNLSVRELRSTKMASRSRSDTFHMSLVTHLGSFKCLQGASLTTGGDFILHVELDNDRLDLDGPAVHAEGELPVGLVRMSRKGKVIWEAPHKHGDYIGNLVVGTTVFYYILQSLSTDRDSFVARSLDDGTVVLQQDVPFEITRYSTCRLRLFGKAQWAAFEDAEGDAWIIDTSTGKIVSCLNLGFSPGLSLSLTESRFWRFGSWDPEDFPLGRENCDDHIAAPFIDMGPSLNFPPRAQGVIIGYDGDRQLSFRLKRDRQPLVARISVSSQISQEYVRTDELTPPHLTESRSMTVTLPSSSQRMGSTRLDLGLFRRRRKPDLDRVSASMVNDYLVVDAPTERLLILVDFWPDW